MNANTAIAQNATALNAEAIRAAESVIIDSLLQTMDARGDVEMLPGLPGAKRADEEVMLIGFPY